MVSDHFSPAQPPAGFKVQATVSTALDHGNDLLTSFPASMLAPFNPFPTLHLASYSAEIFVCFWKPPCPLSCHLIPLSLLSSHPALLAFPCTRLAHSTRGLHLLFPLLEWSPPDICVISSLIWPFSFSYYASSPHGIYYFITYSIFLLGTLLPASIGYKHRNGTAVTWLPLQCLGQSLMQERSSVNFEWTHEGAVWDLWDMQKGVLP